MGLLEKLGLSVLLLVAIVCVSTAFKTPDASKNHHHADGMENGDDIINWNGLDYEYGMFDHSSEVVKKKNETSTVTSNKTSVSNQSKYLNDEYDYSGESWTWWGDSYEDDDDYSAEHQEEHAKITLYHEKVTSTVKASTSPEKTQKVEVTTAKASKSTEKVTPIAEKKPSQQDKDYWNESEGDEDDGMGEGDDKKVVGLPTDNDADADKYLNPDKYQDQQHAHHLEDQLTRIWTVQYDETHLPCIMLRGNIKLIVPVNPTWFNKDFVEIDVPNEAEASGTCNSLNDDYQEIKLQWNVTIPKRNKVYQNSVYFGFATNWTSEYSELKIAEDKYAMVAITVVYYNGELKNRDDGLVSYSVSDLMEYVTPRNESMSCLKDNQVLIVGSMQLTLGNMQIEAFRPNVETLTVGEFSRSVLCESDEVYVFDAVMTYIIWFWIAALMVVLLIFFVLLSLGYRRRRCQEGNGGFGYKVLEA